MGNALVIFKIFVEDPEQIESVVERLKAVSEGECKEVKREPIGFGVEAIKAGFVIPDKVDGAMDKLEAAVKGVEGINEVEVEGVTLL